MIKIKWNRAKLGLRAMLIASLTLVFTGCQSLDKAKSREQTSLTEPYERFLRNVEIGSIDNVLLTANIALPLHKSARPRPAIVLLHGGGFISGSKDKFDTTLPKYAKQLNMIAVAPMYRLAPEHGFPAAIEDVKACIRFLKAHAEALNLDPDKIIVAGVSAGAYLATMAAVTGNDNSFAKHGLFTEFNSSILAAISQAGPIGNFQLNKYADVPVVERLFQHTQISTEEANRLVSPSTYLDKNDPPMFIVHGDADPRIPVEMSREFTALLEDIGIEHEYHEIKGATHSLNQSQPQKARAIRQKELMFIKRITR